MNKKDPKLRAELRALGISCGDWKFFLYCQLWRLTVLAGQSLKAKMAETKEVEGQVPAISLASHSSTEFSETYLWPTGELALGLETASSESRNLLPSQTS